MNTLCVHIFPLPRSLCCPLSLAHTHTHSCVLKKKKAQLGLASSLLLILCAAAAAAAVAAADGMFGQWNVFTTNGPYVGHAVLKYSAVSQ